MARRVATKRLTAPVAGVVEYNCPEWWKPRPYQYELHNRMPCMAGSGATNDRIVLVWHRRAGKDLSSLAMTIREMQSRIGHYVHILPTLKQARKVIWDGKDNAGVPFLSRFPGIDQPGHEQSLVLEKNETELKIVMRPFEGQPGYGSLKAEGSTWQLCGADDPDSLRGPNYVGAVLSEYSEMKEDVWPVIQPAIEASRGWSLFNFTPKGRNHAYKLYQMAKSDPRWFAQLLTIEDTRNEEGQRIVTQEQIEQLRRENTPEEFIQQEYFCSFEGFLRGTIFGDLLIQARKDKRIGGVPWNANLPVGTCWDIGRYDHTAIWFYQRRGDSICFIDYYEDRLKGADFYAKLCREKPYHLTKCILPHDAKATSFAATQSTEAFLSRTLRGVTVAEKTSVQAQIDMTRRMFSRFCFDDVKCAQGIEHLENYRRKFDENLQEYSGDPVHDEHSHASSAVMTGAVGGLEYPLEFRDRFVPVIESAFNVFENASVN